MYLIRDSVVDRVTGLLVGRDDHVEMAEEAIVLLKDHIKRKTYAKNAMQDAKHLDWNVTADSIHQILMTHKIVRPQSISERYA